MEESEREKQTLADEYAKTVLKRMKDVLALAESDFREAEARRDERLGNEKPHICLRALGVSAAKRGRQWLRRPLTRGKRTVKLENMFSTRARRVSSGSRIRSTPTE